MEKTRENGKKKRKIMKARDDPQKSYLDFYNHFKPEAYLTPYKKHILWKGGTVVSLNHWHDPKY